MPIPIATRDIFVEANGIRHHLIARGSPGLPAVMMIHGLAGQARVFDVVAAHLAANFHVYCLDVRGRGESAWGALEEYGTDTYVSDLEAVREALGLQRFTLIGTSMGGIISMNYAPKYPQRVDRVVLNDIGPEIDPAGLKRIFAYVGDAPEMFADVKAVLKYYRENYGPMVEHLPEDQVVEFARANVRKDDNGMYVWKMDPAVRKFGGPQPTMDQWEAAKGIAAPVLILRGANSDVLNAAIAAKMVEVMPNARLVEIPGVGHAPILSEPESVRALDAFLSA
ncbi:MAG: alpha/beta hydrolase [Anaerolineaceae bacterium]